MSADVRSYDARLGRLVIDTMPTMPTLAERDAMQLRRARQICRTWRSHCAWMLGQTLGAGVPRRGCHLGPLDPRGRRLAARAARCVAEHQLVTHRYCDVWGEG